MCLLAVVFMFVISWNEVARIAFIFCLGYKNGTKDIGDIRLFIVLE